MGGTGLLPRLVIVSSSGSNVGNVSGIAGGDVDHDRSLGSDVARMKGIQNKIQTKGTKFL